MLTDNGRAALAFYWAMAMPDMARAVDSIGQSLMALGAVGNLERHLERHLEPRHVVEFEEMARVFADLAKLVARRAEVKREDLR